jgi:hypothetical protein
MTTTAHTMNITRPKSSHHSKHNRNPFCFSFTEAAFMLPRGVSYFPVGLEDVPEVHASDLMSMLLTVFGF